FKLIEISMTRELSPIKDVTSTIKLYKVLKSINPDIVHLHSSKAGVIGRISNAFLFKKNKVFYTPHGYSFLRRDISSFHVKMFWIIEKLNQLILGGITIACGDTEYLEAQKIGAALLVRNGVNTNLIVQKQEKIEQDMYTIGTVGR